MGASVWKTRADEAAGTLRFVGMAFALAGVVRINAREGGATLALPAGTFTGLDIADRQVLADWLQDVDGIDTVMDFFPRRWNVAGARGILGVFETGKQTATWLIVRHGSGWVLLRCQDSFVSNLTIGLVDILRLIDGQRGG